MKTVSNRSRIAFAAALLLVAASAVARQDGGPHGDRSGHRGPPDAEMRVAKMTQMLELTDEQSAQLLVVMQDLDVVNIPSDAKCDAGGGGGDEDPEPTCGCQGVGDAMPFGGLALLLALVRRRRR